MPQAVASWLGGLAFASGTAIGTSAAIFLANYGAAAITAGFVGLSYAASRSQQRKLARAQQAAYEASLTDRKVTIRSPILPRNIVFGRDRASGMIPCWFNWGNIKQYHTFAVTLAGHECDAVETYYFNGEPVALDGDGWVTTSKYTRKRVVNFNETVTLDGAGSAALTHTPVGNSANSSTVVGPYDPEYGQQVYQATFSGNTITAPGAAGLTVEVFYSYEVVDYLFRIWTYLGAPGQTASQPLMDAALNATGSSSAWGSSRKGTQVCYCVVQMEADFDVLGQIGVPNISAVVRGVKAFDTRTSTTAWTENPAMLARWFLVDSPYSPSTSPGEIGADELEASANVCDEVIQIAPDLSAKRYTCNGQLTTDASPLDNLGHILDSMDGQAVYVTGAFQLVAGYYRAPTLTINESMCNDQEIRVSPAVTKDRLFNTVVGTFVDSTKDYARTSYPAMSVSAYVTQDGGEVLPSTQDFELVNDPRRCQMIAWQRLTRARQGLTVQFGTNLKGYDTWPTQGVYLDFKEFFGNTPKECVVTRRELNGGAITYTVQETGSAVWSWDYNNANSIVDLPNTSLPNPFSLDAPVILSAESGDSQLLIGTDGTIISRIKATINPSANFYVINGGLIETRFAVTGTDLWQAGETQPGNSSEFWLNPVEDGLNYTFQARFRNSAGRVSSWSATWMHTVIGKLEPPPPVTGVGVATDRVFFNELTKAEIKDLAGYLIRSVPGTVPQWSLGTLLHEGIVTESPWQFVSALYGVQTIMVAAIDTTGNVGPIESTSWATQDFGSPNLTNAIQIVDYGDEGWPGEITNGSIDSDNCIVADVDPAADFWTIGGGSFWVRDNISDFWGGTLYLPLVYEFKFTPEYGGGQILLDLETTGSRRTIEYKVDGAEFGDFWIGNGGAGGVDDFWSGDTFWGSSEWKPWLGSTVSNADQSVLWRITIDGGPQQGTICMVRAALVLELVSQVFSSRSFPDTGLRLDPSLGTPPRNWVSISAVSPTPDGSSAVTGRVIDYDPELGPLVVLLNNSGVAVTDTGNAVVYGFEDKE